MREAADGLWNDLTRRQHSARIPESAKLKGEAEAIACMATGSNDFEVIVRQCVVVEDGGFVGREVEQRRTLAGGQNGTSWHA